MKMLNAEQIRQWDQFTIEHEPIASIDLMERAAGECFAWLESNHKQLKPVHIFCGKGNNGGDGLAIARMLTRVTENITVHILEFGHNGTDDFQTNLSRLHQHPQVAIRFIQSEENFPSLQKDELIIDALFGSGLNRALAGVTAKLVEHINHCGAEVISIDIPSGLFTDQSSKDNPSIHAHHTLAFQVVKAAFVVAENAKAIGEVHVLDIGLHPTFYETAETATTWIDRTLILDIYKPRNAFAHKGSFGHALIVAGSYGKTGAAVLAAKACLHTGVGLLTCHVPSSAYNIMQTSIPEAMTVTDFNSSYSTDLEVDLEQFKAIGIGPGLGTANETKNMLQDTFQQAPYPIVIDADALNCIASGSPSTDLIPKQSILTPHPKEFERLFGYTDNEFDRIKLALKKAKEQNSESGIRTGFPETEEL